MVEAILPARSAQQRSLALWPSRLDWMIFVAAATMPFLPKIGVAHHVYLNLFDGAMILLYPLFLYDDRYLLGFPAQRYLISMWATMALLCLVYVFADHSSILGPAKLAKRLLYVPLIYVGYRVYSGRTVKWMVWLGAISIVWVSAIFVIFIWRDSFSYGIWNPSLVFGGLVNRYIDPFSGSLELRHVQSGGSAGIWGTYCDLVFVLALYAWRVRLVSWRVFFAVAASAITSVFLTPSRESLLVLAVICALIVFESVNPLRMTLSRDGLVAAALAIVATAAGLIYTKSLAIVEKLIYMFHAIATTGTESNIQDRFDFWRDAIRAMFHFPVSLLGGVGYRSPAYLAAMQSIPLDHRLALVKYGTAFESVPVQSLAFGGIVALALTLVFVLYLWRFVAAHRRHPLFRYIQMLLAGLMLTQLTGAAAFADVLYAWLLLVIGFLYRVADDMGG